MTNKIFTALIVLSFIGFLLCDFSAAEQPDLTSHRAICKMKIVQKRLQDFDRDIMHIARRVTDHELARYVRAREIEAAPAFLPNYHELKTIRPQMSLINTDSNVINPSVFSPCSSVANK
jgi:hypothetical protein